MPNTSRVSGHGLQRRAFLRLLLVGGSAAVLAACQQSPVAPAPTAKPAAEPAAQPKAAAPAAGAPAAEWEKQWNEWLEGAKKEGKLVISGPPTAEVRTDLAAAFQKRFGIEMEYLGGRTGDLLTRVESERAAGQYTLDAMIAGAQSMYTRAYGNILDPLPPVLIHPEAIDPSKWTAGKLWYMDPEQKYILRLSNQASHFMGVNSQAMDPKEIKAWKDLLDPKYKGKIASYDPTVSGPGWPPAAYLLKVIGEDYLRGIYQEQQAAVTRDERQMSDWLARGTYPIAMSIGSNEVVALQKDGFPIVVLTNLPDAPGTVSAGFGLLGIVNQAPHPNAAKLFVNWMAMKEGSEVYNRAQVTVSNRKDVDNSWSPDYTIPKSGIDYFDTYDWEWTINGFNPAELERMKRLTAR